MPSNATVGALLYAIVVAVSAPIQAPSNSAEQAITCMFDFLRAVPGVMNPRITRRTKDYSIIEYTYLDEARMRRRSEILVNNERNQDGSVLYRNPSDISYGGPLTLEIAIVLESKCRAFGYDLTR